jgi:hypothetical protein
VPGERDAYAGVVEDPEDRTHLGGVAVPSGTEPWVVEEGGLATRDATGQAGPEPACLRRAVRDVDAAVEADRVPLAEVEPVVAVAGPACPPQ